MRITIIEVLIVFTLTSFALGETIHVPGDYPTIQQAADAAINGDTVLVQPGTYAPVHMTTKAIIVMSSNGPYSTTIKGDPYKVPVVNCGSGFVLDGFTVTSGHIFGGIHATGSTIQNCIVSNNHSENSGGGMKINGTTKLVNNIICNNEASDFGSTGERGGGVEIIGGGSPIITNTTICNNKSDYGGGICCTNNATPIITNGILWGNTATQSGNQIFGSGSVVTYSVVEGGWPGTGNMTSDPLLTSNFRLNSYSPCIDKGFNGAAGMLPVDIDGEMRIVNGIVDMGADEYYIADSLTANTNSLPASTGGSVFFTLDAGTAHAWQDYVILISVTGSSPGTKLPGGQLVLPINWDAVTEFGISALNTQFFMNFLGKLNGIGESAALFNVPFPLPSSLVGETITFAFATFNPWDFASNHVDVEITP